VPKDDVDNLARMFRALGNPKRLRLFLNLLDESKLDLAKGRVHDCFLAKLLAGLNDLGAPTVSHHVKELADAGLITTQREGKQLTCSVDPVGLATLRAALALASKASTNHSKVAQS
jgi:ArsR family transcriptional regulator, arsenate/arsenite/antimonite-responsive transcriptional repressor